MGVRKHPRSYLKDQVIPKWITGKVLDPDRRPIT